MSKYEGHTPGDWVTQESSLTIYAVDADGLTNAIATVLTSVMASGSRVSYKEAQANAKVLADSPALAERTRRALNKLRYMSSGGSFLAPTHNDIGHLIRILEGEEDKE